MLEPARDRGWLDSGEARLVAIGITASAAVAVIGYALQVRLMSILLLVFHVAALTILALAWVRAKAAAAEARRNAHDVDFLAGRLMRLEQQQARIPQGGSPVLRSTMAEVTGTVGMLGGVVRELARTVAAQNRDVADIKDSLQQPAGAAARPSLRRVDERPVAVAVVQPDPSLLPLRPLETESELHRTRLVTQAFEADRIEVHLQPVVSLPNRKVRFYEALARLRLDDGTLLAPAEFLSRIERLGRAPEFDRRVLTRAMAVARHLMSRGSEAIVAVNLSPRSVTHPDFIDQLQGMVAASPEIVGKIVLELSQACWRGLDDGERGALAALGRCGLPLSLDQAPDLSLDARALSESGVRFLKFPAEMLIAAAGENNEADLCVRDFASLLRKSGIRLIADRVDHEDMVPTLVDLGVPLAQGFVFAAPRAVRAEVLGPAAMPLRATELRRVG
ncbi:EAL domain-containing protein [Microvirga antarctica]|uniref:EAL domain-containing protein n=1 Tax=Microvirga antarctica TaxID=2819233 RepID=UPI001B30160E|nr:EAL domain-containing protein [Microvirga antarctica]